jgi:hypothetical protein
MLCTVPVWSGPPFYDFTPVTNLALDTPLLSFSLFMNFFYRCFIQKPLCCYKGASKYKLRLLWWFGSTAGTEAQYGSASVVRSVRVEIVVIWIGCSRPLHIPVILFGFAAASCRRTEHVLAFQWRSWSHDHIISPGHDTVSGNKVFRALGWTDDNIISPRCNQTTTSAQSRGESKISESSTTWIRDTANHQQHRASILAYRQ